LTGGRRTDFEPAFASAVSRWFDDHATDGIFTTDVSLTIKSWNRWLTTLTGLSADQVVGRLLFDVFPSLVDRGLDQRYADALAGEVQVLSHTLHQFILPAAHQADRVRMIQSGRIAPLRDGDQVIGTITIVEDVSERGRPVCRRRLQP
jgi:PAS domain S-box-containing protein